MSISYNRYYPRISQILSGDKIPDSLGSIKDAVVSQNTPYHRTKCHGTYGVDETYPNVLIPASYVGTDPLLAQSNFDGNEFLNWFNNSWFAVGSNAGMLSPSYTYIAPPLDGVWATAPYLHNGSVPTLQDLLNSSQRPTYWKRSFNTNDYDFDRVGWTYTSEAGAFDNETYNTTLPGYGNSGHVFGDVLNEEEVTSLIEYLKTL